MTKDEAIQWMQLGAKCEHRYFGTGEWVSIDETGLYILEDGVRCTPDEFWRWRTESFWERDWDFAKGWDPYVCIAAREYGCLIAEVNEPMRQAMKLKYFSLAYGGYRSL